jgi:hypothetical protein
MDLNGKKIILGSNSPRRRELLKGLDVEFVIDTKTNFVESIPPDAPHESVPVLMAEGKSLGFHRPLGDDEVLITADTMVLCGKDILGKPHSKEEAAEMLRLLSGKEHKVLTAVTLRDSRHFRTFTDTAHVFFKELTESEIDYYLNRYKPYDKAGSYGVQEWIGYIGIERIDGSYFNVMGFPTSKVYKELSEFVL